MKPQRISRSREGEKERYRGLELGGFANCADLNGKKKFKLLFFSLNFHEVFGEKKIETEREIRI